MSNLIEKKKKKCVANKSSSTWALQIGKLRSLLRVEEVSLCRHQLHPQRNCLVQAGGGGGKIRQNDKKILEATQTQPTL